MSLKNFKSNNISNIVEELENLYQKTHLQFPYPIEQFYLKTNGGFFDVYLIKNQIEPWLTFSLFENYIRIYEFYSIDDIIEKYEYLKEEASIYLDVEDEKFYLNYLLPISDVNSVDCICICCKGDNVGKLYLVEWAVSASKGILPLPEQLIANSFEELLEKMVLEEDDDEYQKLLRQ